MQIRSSILALVFVALAAGSAQAQQAIAGTTFFFDHPAADAADTARYELCVDVATFPDAALAGCTTVAVLRSGSTDVYSFTLPSTVPRGNHKLSVRAVGFLTTGYSGPSNVIDARIIGKPGPPVLLRLPAAVVGQ